MLLISDAVAALPAFDDDWNDTAGSSRNLSTDELSYSLRRAKYRFRFKIPLVSNCYKIKCVERFFPETTAGLSLNSLELISGGYWAPYVFLDEPDWESANPVQAEARAVLASNGSLAAIVITNPGSGYAVAPSVYIDEPYTSGGTQATATATIDTDPESPTYGQVTGITLTSAGNYTPEIVISAPTGTPPGTQAIAVVTAMDVSGAIASISLTNAGSGYIGVPTIGVNGAGSGEVIHVHIGTETAREYTWDGTVPSGYSPTDSATWPILGPYELNEPETDGTVTVANVLAACEGCT